VTPGSTIEAPTDAAAEEATEALSAADRAALDDADAALQARAEKLAAEALEEEQAELDAKPSQSKPDLPEGAADDPEGDPDGGPDSEPGPTLAEELAAAAGITAEREAGEALPAGNAPLLGLTWADLIGGEEPTAVKIRLQGGAIEVIPPEGGLKKGSSHVLQVEVVVSALEIADTRDKETGDVTATVDTRKLKIRSARFIETPSA
jgi:hypothetical protein